MKVARYTPIVLLTALGTYWVSSQTDQADDDVDSKVKVVKPIPTVVKAIEVSKITDLTPEETVALKQIAEFLDKYTGNGKFNYGTMDRVIEGLYYDKQGIKDGATNFAERLMANRYSKINLDDLDNISAGNRVVLNAVRNSVKSQATSEMTDDFKTHRIDPKTGDVSDDAPIKHFVTRTELLQFRSGHLVVKDLLNRTFATDPNHQEVIFPEGMNAEAARHILAFKPGLPPGAEVVNKLSSK